MAGKSDPAGASSDDMDRRIRLVGPDGSSSLVRPHDEVLWLANQLGLELIFVDGEADPPVYRLGIPATRHAKVRIPQVSASPVGPPLRQAATRQQLTNVHLIPELDAAAAAWSGWRIAAGTASPSGPARSHR